jgi:SAM-dependent methyltransferase
MTDHQHHAAAAAGFDEATVFDAAFWDARYGSASALWSGKPNPQLVTEAADLEPTTALDVGSGEGADAIWLAQHGWQVTALDISQVALDRAATQARTVDPAAAERIHWVQGDLTAGLDLGLRFGLVSSQFMHLPGAQREDLFRQLAAAVAPGGTLLIVGHDLADLDTAPQMRPHRPDLMFTSAEVVALLDPTDWTVVAAESRRRTARDPDGQPVDVADAVVVARRR